MNALGMNSILYSCEVGIGTYISRNSEFTSVRIGKFCSIGSFCINTTGRHPTKVLVSTHPAFFSVSKVAGFTFSNENKFVELNRIDTRWLVDIGNDVWIGDRVTILDGITIGDGAIIGANSLVTRNIEPYTINFGIPSRKIRNRFTDEQISFLLEFKWWDKDFEWLRGNSDLFDDVDSLIKSQN